MSLSSLLPFTPSLLLHLLQTRRCSPPSSPSPWSFSLPTAILFIDVSGFTSMTESFANAAAWGLEQLTANLNAYFTAILALIEQHQGDLLKVAGDALIVAFYDLTEADQAQAKAAQAPLPLLCHRAVSCALALQAAPSFTAGGVTLGMHIAVTCGATTYIGVGGVPQLWGAAARSSEERAANQAATPLSSPTSHSSSSSWPASPASVSASASVSEGGPRWEFLAVGSAFEELSTAVHDSQTGQVVVSDMTWKRLLEVADVSASKVQGDSPNLLITACALRLPPSPVDLQHLPTAQSGANRAGAGVSALPLSSFLMPALLSRVSADLSEPSHWLGEYRRVTVLFVSLPKPEECVLDASSASAASALPSSPAWLLSFHALFRTLQQCIVRVEGQVRQLLVDDKGCVMIGAFGLPPFAHEDDAARAVSAALDLLAAVRQLHPAAADRVSVGVTTGRAWCGAVGSEARKEYAMVGDIVNLSARIMANPLCRQRVLCDEETVKACGDRVRFSPATEVIKVVKGRSGPLTLYEPLLKMRRLASTAYSIPPSTPPTLLQAASMEPFAPLHPNNPAPEARGPPASDLKPGSRAAIFQAILALVEPPAAAGAAGASGCVVVIEGGPGQGKTWLARQVLDACVARGVTLVLGAADSVEISTPFFAFIPVLQDAVRREWERQHQLSADPTATPRPATPSQAQLTATVSALLPPADRQYLPLLLDALFQTEAEEDGQGRAAADRVVEAWQQRPKALTAEGIVEVWQRPKVLRRLMRSLLRHLFTTEPAALLCIEDGHWLDLQSWLLLKELAEAEPGVRLLLTTRPLASVGGPSSPAPNPLSIPAIYESICRGAATRHFVLTGVDEAASAALAARFLRCARVDEALAQIVHARSDGIPLFIQHLVAYMQHGELISIDPATNCAFLTEKHLLDSSLPSSLESLLASLLDRLQSQCALALKVASVIGRHFTCSLLAASHPMHVSREVVVRMLEAAQLQSVVDEEREDGGELSADDSFYRFTHQLLRDAAYHALLYHQRRDLHASVADHIAALHSRAWKGSPTSVHLLASHYWLSLCNSADVLIEQPEQRLVEAAINYLLRSAAANTQMGVLDDAALFLSRAARCVHKLQDAERREYWELRWLTSVVGTELITNAPVLVGLCKACGIVEPKAEPTTKLTHQCQHNLAHRLLPLLDSPTATAGLSALRIQDIRFNTLMTLWLGSWTAGKGASLSSAEALEAFVASADGSEAGYYGTEAFFALTNTYFGCNKFEELRRAFERLETHQHYRDVLEGKAKFTRYALGVIPVARVAMNQARYRWLKGQLRTFWMGMRQVMPVTVASGHQPSIPAAWMAILKTVMCAGAEPTAVKLGEQAVAVLPAAFSKPLHLVWLTRRCMAVTLQVWKHGDAAPPPSLTAPVIGAVSLPYEAELLATIRQCIDDGESLCMMFHFIFQAFPSVIDFRPEMPLSIHEAMLQLLHKFQDRFGANFTTVEITRSEAALLIRYIQAGQGDAAQQAKEAERLLQSALSAVVYEKTLALKVVMTWTELRVWQGKWKEAEVELQRALDSLPEEGKGSESFWVKTAEKMLEEVRRGQKELEEKGQ